jgi:hypothetical protein
VRDGQGFTEAQTRQLWQLARAISRRICDCHNWPSNDASLVRIIQRGTYEGLDATQALNAEISRGSVGRRLLDWFDSFVFSDAANRK